MIGLPVLHTGAIRIHGTLATHLPTCSFLGGSRLPHNSRGGLPSSLGRRKASTRHTRSIWQARHQVTVVNIGRHSSKDSIYDDEIAEYSRRLRPSFQLDLKWIKPANAMDSILACTRDSTVICLDACGDLPGSSEQFAKRLYDRFETGRGKITFVIGDAEGLPQELRKYAQSKEGKQRLELWSLGTLTLTHKMVSCRTFRGHVLGS